MILADTSIWIDHFRSAPSQLAPYLASDEVAIHDHVIGELSLGTLARRGQILDALASLPKSPNTRDDEVISFIERRKLYGVGIGFTDAHLLAAVLLAPGMRLWTLDRRLHRAAAMFGVAMPGGAA